jgi:hypothetical protein
MLFEKHLKLFAVLAQIANLKPHANNAPVAFEQRRGTAFEPGQGEPKNRYQHNRALVAFLASPPNGACMWEE